MFILKDLNNVVISSGNEIEYGVFDEPNLNKWKIVSDAFMFYIIGDNLSIEEVQNLPLDYKDYKYCYTEETGFYVNEGFSDPVNTEDKIKQLEGENVNLKQQLNIMQEALDFLAMK